MAIEFHSLSLLEEGYRLLGSWGYRLVTDDGAKVDRQYVQQLKNFHKRVLCLPN